MDAPASRGSIWESLTEADRDAIRAAFRPLGTVSPESMVASAASISTLLGHLKKPDVREVGYRLIAISEGLLPLETDLIQVHFYFFGVGQFFYRFRDVDSFALPKAIEAFEKQALISPSVRARLRDSMPGTPVRHGGFDQLRIIYEKAGNYLDAIRVCETASADGWAGDWESQIRRLSGKILRSD
jgi:hypothetical protein